MIDDLDTDIIMAKIMVKFYVITLGGAKILRIRIKFTYITVIK